MANEQIYISYAYRDQQAALALTQALEAAGLRCFIAYRDMSPGAVWQDSILQAIESAGLIVLLFSQAAATSQNVLREIEFGAGRGRPIIPVRLDNGRTPLALDYNLGSKQWVDARDGDFGRVVQAARTILLGGAGQAMGTNVPEAKAPGRPTPPEPTPTARARRGAENWLEKLASAMGLRPPAAPGRARKPSPETLAATLAEELWASRFEDLARTRPSSQALSILDEAQKGLGAEFDRLALQAAQIALLGDPGRRIDAIDNALRQLGRLRSELPRRPGPFEAAVSQLAGDWTALFQQARSAAEVQVEAAREIENPFIFGNPVHAEQDGLFTGRRDIVLEIERDILRAAQTPTLLLYGQRRMGKTSILNQLPALLGPMFLSVTADCQAPAMAESPAAMLRYLSRCFANALNARLRIAPDDEAGRSARGASLIPLDQLQTNPYSVFDDWLEVFESRLPSDTRVLLCLDEFERLQATIDAGWGERLFDALRHWLQYRPAISLMFVGSHTFEQMGPAWTDRFLHARRLKVSFLAEADVRQLLTRPSPTFNLAYAPGAVEAVFAASHGQPFLTQALASELVHHMNRTKRRIAEPGDVESSMVEVLERSAEYFADLWQGRSAPERALMAAAARGDHVDPHSPAAQSLRDYDVLDDQGRLLVPLVSRWILTRAPQVSAPPDEAHPVSTGMQ